MAEHWVYGVHAVKSLLNNPHRQITKLFISKERNDTRIQPLLLQAQQLKVAIEVVSVQKMSQLFPQYCHQGIIASATSLPEYQEADLGWLLDACQQPPLILVLDGITDPHNLGACLRTADAAGVDFVVIPKDKAVGITPVVSKVACGAAEAIPLVKVTNLVRALECLKQHGVWVYGAAGEASQSLYQLDCQGAIALIMGAEDKGLRRLTREHCDGLFSLPMQGTVESLNVSVAAGVCLYEVVRQRCS